MVGRTAKGTAGVHASCFRRMAMEVERPSPRRALALASLAQARAELQQATQLSEAQRDELAQLRMAADYAAMTGGADVRSGFGTPVAREGRQSVDRERVSPPNLVRPGGGQDRLQRLFQARCK